MHLLHILAALLIAAATTALPAAASEGHDHDHGDAASATAGQALPRFAAVSEAFELVGVLDGRQLTLYLDRFGDNSPVRGAQIELEIGDAKLRAQQHGDDVYEAVLPAVPQAGVLPITATVTAGDEIDLLAGELDIHEAAHADESAAVHPWDHWAARSAAGLAVLLALAWAGRRLMGTRRLRAGGAA